MVSASDKIRICRDKNNTSDYFESCGLNAPKTYNDYTKYPDVFPCFIKPKDGSSSINAFKVNSKEELIEYARKVDDYVIQPFVDGTEYTIDIFCNFDGKPIYITPRIRLAVRSGEVLKTKIDMDESIIKECRNLVDDFKPCGPMTVQLIKDKQSGINYYIEINPRYGGGAPLSMKAGARSAESVLKLLTGIHLEYSEPQQNGMIFSRFDQSVCVDKGDHNRQLTEIRGVIFDLDDAVVN